MKLIDDNSTPVDLRRGPVALLLLTSYSHAPRLRPTPDLRYDLRTATLPPRDILRDRTGISKRVRERILRFEDFSQLLADAETEIRSLMEDMMAGRRKTRYALHEFEPSSQPPGAQPNPRSSPRRTKNPRDDAGVDPDRVDDGKDTGETGRGDTGGPVLSVGAFCISGHHRSVAFIEELAEKSWPEGWEVRVNHRELQRSQAAARDRGEKDREQRRRDQRCSARELGLTRMTAPGLDTRG